MLKVGLTGSIGTGKSTVESIFKELGAYTIDADEVVHKLLEKPEVIEKIRETFGSEVVKNGKIDKKKLAQIIFSNREKKKQLESIIHPLVFEGIQKFFEEVKKKDPCAVAIADVPLMIETGSYKNYDLVIVVYAPKELQLERLLEKGMSKEEALARINAQMNIEEKKKYADIVIENTGTIEDLRKKVKDVYEKLKKISRCTDDRKF